MNPTLKSLLVLSTLAGSLTAIQSANAATNDFSSGDGARFQTSNPVVTVGSKQIKVPTAPYIKNGNIIVPARELADGLGAVIAWNKQSRSVTLTKGNVAVQLKDKQLTIGSRTIKLPVSVTLIGGKAYVPLRAVADAFGADLSWNAKTSAASVNSSDAHASPVAIRYTFDKDAAGWAGGFADLPVKHEGSDYQLVYKWASLPAIDQTQRQGLLLKGMNRSDDLFMYAVRKLGPADGLKPNTTYRVKLSFQLATNESSDTFGIGGSPAESVFIKAGVLNFEPKAVQVPDDQKNLYYRMNLDKGNQITDGKDMKLIGNAAKPDPSKEGFQLKPMQLDTVIKTGANGEAYVIIGSDSGYEGLSTLYLTDIRLDFTKTT